MERPTPPPGQTFRNGGPHEGAVHDGVRRAIVQTLAMALDAYRELNSRKLFWITLILSSIMVAAFAGLGFDDQGYSIFGKSFRHGLFNTRMLPIEQLYKDLFIVAGVQWWLGFFAIILALVSTSTIFPDFLTGGSVDLFLARPMGRVRLFFTKYVMGLLFVGLQVLAFCGACFCVIGFRSGAWVPGVFLAVPLVVLLFSYLWSIMAFFAMLTRSTIASLMLTILAWALIFGVHSADVSLLMMSIGSRVEVRELDKAIMGYQQKIAALEQKIATTQASNFDQSELFQSSRALDRARTERAEASDPYASWQKLMYAVKWPLPKTAETTALIERWLDKQFRPPRGRRSDDQRPRRDDESNFDFLRNPQLRRMVAMEVDQALRTRSEAWVLGTSIAFEGVILLLTAWIFARRDF